MSIIKLSEGEVKPAQVDGLPDVFSSPDFIFVKPRWVSDDEVNICVLCDNKFNQFRRKHHCRQCGRVLCNKCCKDKIPLPQLGIEETERVCDWCRPVAELVARSRSQHINIKENAAEGLSTLCNDEKYLNQIVQLGGIQTLICLSHETANQALLNVMNGLHTLSSQPPLHQVLLNAGIIKCICSILTRTIKTDRSNQQILSHGIHAIMIFCKSSEFRSKVLEDGALDIILDLCWVPDEVTGLVAVRTLGLIVSDTATHDAIIDSQYHALPKIIALTSSQDEQMQEGTLRIIVHLSCGTDWHKHRIIQEDFSAGRCLHKILNSQPNNIQILCNAACIVGNLATSCEDQGVLQELMISVCHLLQSDVCTIEAELLFNISRGIANFASFPGNGPRLITTVPYIMEKCIKSQKVNIRQNGMRALFHILSSNSTDAVLDMIKDLRGLVRCMAEDPELLSNLHKYLLYKSPALYQPV